MSKIHIEYEKRTELERLIRESNFIKIQNKDGFGYDVMLMKPYTYPFSKTEKEYPVYTHATITYWGAKRVARKWQEMRANLQDSTEE